jgi:crotonobetainyl-CoA:carnitine CoA-transferase CaiB-like acyl-CoA transferase
MSTELQGIRVADFSAVVAGPYCTRLMARWGADVIKIEPPEGDHLRSLRPLRDGASAMFGALNAGKRSVSLDLRTDAGRAMAAEIVKWADVIVENFRPGVMARFGLDYDTVSVTSPRSSTCQSAATDSTDPGSAAPHWPRSSTRPRATTSRSWTTTPTCRTLRRLGFTSPTSCRLR